MPDQIGLEASPFDYVAHLVDVFREVKRVLRDDGTLWLNLGDTYMSQPSWGRGDKTSTLEGRKHSEVPHAMKDQLGRHQRGKQPGIKPKDMVGIPWRVAFALQDDGWFLRSDIIWNKLNPMPENVIDRPARSHEYIFLLSKKASYYYDNEAIKEPIAKSTPVQGVVDFGGNKSCANGRNRRTVWTISSQPYEGAHFATFPPKLIEPCILAGSKPGDIVLDVFNGAGTTGLVSIMHNRDYIGIDLNSEYIDMSRERLGKVQPYLLDVKP